MVLQEGLLPWQELNVTAFLISGISTSEPGLTGAPYLDRDGNSYLPLLRQPVMVFSAAPELIRTVRARALSRAVPTSLYIREMFATGHDEANRAAVAAVSTAEMDVVGIAVRAARNTVDRIVKGAQKHA